eukprot:m.73616 g.73616  ORF g.73616 m.73616 type:complete len:707 (+) comp18824_c0_seq2:1094-3214(+)
MCSSRSRTWSKFAESCTLAHHYPRGLALPKKMEKHDGATTESTSTDAPIEEPPPAVEESDSAPQSDRRVTAAGDADDAPTTTAGGKSLDTVIDLKSDEEDADAGTPPDARGLVWSGVTVKVPTRSGEKTILADCAGSCAVGQVACVIGPSGAGKTMLFSTLCGLNAKTLDPGASIKLNGQTLTRDVARSQVAFVAQEESMFATVTPREALLFSARLRLPSATPDETITQLVEDLLTRLGLQDCADTMIGDQLLRGISGGEKRRTAIAVELITQPKTIFLDEPTSGLDSYAALGIIKLLRQLADEGCTVLSTIHQPSSEIFDAFDKVIVMAKGRIMYGGSADVMLTHFSSIGHECPLHYNPADFVLYLMQTESPEALEKIRTSWEASPAFSERNEVRRPSRKSVGAAAMVPQSGPRPGFIPQLKALLTRETQATIRNKPALIARFGLSTCLNLFFAFIFYQVGTATTGCPGFDCTPDIQDHFGAVANIAIGLMFGAAQPTLLAFPLERPTFLREYGTNTYGTLPYFLSKTLVEVVLTFLQILLIFVVVYWVMELQGDIMVLTMAGFGLSLVANSLALVIGCGLSSVKVALELSPLIFVPQILFSGVFIRLESIPEALRWVQYLCSLKWSLNIMMVTEFSEEACKPPSKFLIEPYIANTTENWAEACDDFLDLQDVERGDWELYVGILCGIFIGARVLAAMLLRAKAV